ncbi:MAG: stage III sporulation protein AF [Alicyclobacillaceae bacterium]|nr:stage III sporulation protein AF [Alicyclobacillaceae bacterium]
MTAVGEWLKQIILIVLLAAFTEWLLPTQSMQKYVRTVLGLAVIAAILQPLVPFFRGDWAERLAQSAVEQLTGAASSAAAPAVDVDSLQAQLRRQLSRRADDEAAALVQAAIDSELGIPGARVQVEGGLTPEQMRVAVVLPPAATGQTAAVRNLVARLLGVSADHVSVRAG